MRMDKSYKNNMEQSPVFHKRGSITVEASLVLPLFILAMLSVMGIFSMQSFRMSVDHVLSREARALAESAFKEWSPDINAIEDRFILCLSKNVRGKPPIKGGFEGISLSDSKLENREVIVLNAKYEWELPFLFGSLLNRPAQQSITLHTWTGYGTGLSGLCGDDTKVYVTLTGTVYHLSSGCSHLRIHADPVDGSRIDEMRNSYGARYSSCRECGASKDDGTLYITRTGERYHKSIYCSALKRTVRVITLKEAEELSLRPCLTCSR